MSPASQRPIPGDADEYGELQGSNAPEGVQAPSPALHPSMSRGERAASLLHDIGKLETSRQLLYKAARLTTDEMVESRKPPEGGVRLLEPVGGSLRRVLPIILAHHDKYDGSGYHAASGEDIPLEARIIAVADV